MYIYHFPFFIHQPDRSQMSNICGDLFTVLEKPVVKVYVQILYSVIYIYIYTLIYIIYLYQYLYLYLYLYNFSVILYVTINQTSISYFYVVSSCFIWLIGLLCCSSGHTRLPCRASPSCQAYTLQSLHSQVSLFTTHLALFCLILSLSPLSSWKTLLLEIQLRVKGNSFSDFLSDGASSHSISIPLQVIYFFLEACFSLSFPVLLLCLKVNSV